MRSSILKCYNLLSASRRVSSEVATNSSCPCASLSGTIGPLCCSSSSDSKTAHSAFLEDVRSGRSSDDACESKEQCSREEHYEWRCAWVLILSYTYRCVQEAFIYRYRWYRSMNRPEGKATWPRHIGGGYLLNFCFWLQVIYCSPRLWHDPGARWHHSEIFAKRPRVVVVDIRSATKAAFDVLALGYDKEHSATERSRIKTFIRALSFRGGFQNSRLNEESLRPSGTSSCLASPPIPATLVRNCVLRPEHSVWYPPLLAYSLRLLGNFDLRTGSVSCDVSLEIPKLEQQPKRRFEIVVQSIVMMPLQRWWQFLGAWVSSTNRWAETRTQFEGYSPLESSHSRNRSLEVCVLGKMRNICHGIGAVCIVGSDSYTIDQHHRSP